MNDPASNAAPSASRDIETDRPAGFERRLLDALTAADAVAGRPPPAGLRPAIRIRLALLGAAALLVIGGGAAVAAIYLGVPTFQPAAEAVVAGDSLILKGSGCAPGGEVAVSLDAGDRLAAATAAADGTFMVELALPALTTIGQHQAVAACRDGAGHDLLQRAGFSMLASRPPLGAGFEVAGAASPGGRALAKGAGCRPGTAVEAVLDDRVAVGSLIADGTGGFVVEFAVPSGTALGTHELSATCQSGDGSPLTQRASLPVVRAEPAPPPTKGP